MGRVGLTSSLPLSSISGAPALSVDVSRHFGPKENFGLLGEGRGRQDARLSVGAVPQVGFRGYPDEVTRSLEGVLVTPPRERRGVSVSSSVVPTIGALSPRSGGK